MKHKCLPLILILALLFIISACATPEAPPASTPTAATGQTELTQKPTPAPIPTPSPEPSPSATDAWGVYQEDAEEVIADGFYTLPLTDGIKERITGMSFPEGEDGISYDDLRYIRLQYVDFEGNVHEDGELIVNRKLAREVTEIFYALYEAQYPFSSVRLVDDFGEPGDDNFSMAANNTSAFNYRYVTGTDTLSLHSFGNAIDINPRMNPYIDGERVAPENGEEYADRSLGLPGMIDDEDLCYRLFTERGWKWGGNWAGDKDYQHFSKKTE